MCDSGRKLSATSLPSNGIWMAAAIWVFARQFRAATGTTPHQWLLAQRILLARRLLETTDLSIDRVADDAGFGSPAALRMHFQRSVHTSPQAYRRVFSQAAS